MIVETYRRLENFWFSINQKIRFLLVGGFNTGTSFLIYYAFLYITQGREQVSLLLMNVININISIMTMRYYVFQSKGNFINTGLLAFFVRVIHFKEWLPADSIILMLPNLNKAAAQLCCIVIITFLTFFIHKYFSFRKNI